MLEHLPPEPGALAGIDVDAVRISEAPAEEQGQLKLSPRGGGAESGREGARVGSQVGDVGLGEDAGDVGGLHDHVGAVGGGEGLVVAEVVEAERGREGGERQRGRDLGVDGVGQAARPLEAGPAPSAGAGGVHGRAVGGRNPRCGEVREGSGGLEFVRWRRRRRGLVLLELILISVSIPILSSKGEIPGRGMLAIYLLRPPAGGCNRPGLFSFRGFTVALLTKNLE